MLAVWYIAYTDKMTTAFQSVERLKVWQKAMDLVVTTYRLSSQLPADERFGLVSQMRRAADISACQYCRRIRPLERS